MSTSDLPSISDLLAIIEQQNTVIAALEARVKELEAEIARLRQDPPSGAARPTPSFVKPNRVREKKTERKRRDHAFSRPCEEPTQIAEHALEQCPDCGRRLCGGWVHRTRQVIEIPELRYQVIEHRVLGRRCGVCARNHIARPDLSDEVFGSHRFGVRLMSLVSYWKIVCRMPVRTIQRTLKAVYGLKIGCGEISELLHAAASAGEPHYAHLRETLRESDYIHGDETGWREDGENGYLWSFSTPGLRYFTRDKSRGHQVPEGVLGSTYRGILVSDFYGGYHYHLGLHQRCWVHFLRDLRALKEAHPEDEDVRQWVEAVIQVYRDAREFTSDERRVRVRARERFQDRLAALGQPYARTQAKQTVLAERIMRFSNELFTFVEHPQVPSENNAAERAIRPSVIERKVTGGTRSGRGSHTHSVLLSLFQTWEVRGLDMLQTCRMMLTCKLAPT